VKTENDVKNKENCKEDCRTDNEVFFRKDEEN